MKAVCMIGLVILSSSMASAGIIPWQAQPNPNVSTTTVDNQTVPNFDWTGQTFTQTSTVLPGGTPATSSAQFYMNWLNTSLPVGPSQTISYTLERSVSGTSTYKWKWQNPTNPSVTQLPLSILGTENISEWMALSPGASVPYYNVSGSVSDGMPDAVVVPWTNWSTSCLSSCIIPTAGATTPTMSVSPAIDFKIAVQPYAGRISTGTGMSMSCSYGVLELTTPDATALPGTFISPTLWDNNNEYIYDTVVPTSGTEGGHLFVPATITATAGDTTWLAKHTDAHFDAPLGQPAAHTWIPAGGGVSVNTPHATDTRISTNGNYNDFVFFGLPAQNSDFGRHKETSTLNGSDYQMATFETFFDAASSNYPGSYNDWTRTNGRDATKRYWTPNWFHYYNQVYPSTGTFLPDSPQTASTSHCDSFKTNGVYQIHIASEVVPGPIYVRVFTTGGNFIQYAGILQVPGILGYVCLNAHEKGHQDCFNNTGMVSQGPAPSSQVLASPDLDCLNSAWEDAHHMDSASADTTGAYGPINKQTGAIQGGDIPDGEVVADVPALGEVFNKKALWKSDWSSVGIQFGSTPPITDNPLEAVPKSHESSIDSRQSATVRRILDHLIWCRVHDRQTLLPTWSVRCGQRL